MTSIFLKYLQPFTIWLQNNPNFALLMTFLISFAESVIILGGLIPGSIMMTTIGVLAGLGYMRIDLTFVAAAVGAILGDSLSFILGYIFKDRLVSMWPIRKYPHWIQYGRSYFAKHGGKSIIIGRFFGPLRAIIPLIAGIMRMNRLYFLWTATFAAILWTLLYVLPGVLIGIASQDLSFEDASRLFLLILILLLGSWGLIYIIKWLTKYFHYWLRKSIDEKTILLIIFFISSILALLGLFFVFKNTYVSNLNQDILLFLQSTITPWSYKLTLLLEIIIHPLTLLTLFLTISFYLILWSRNFIMLFYWLSLGISCLIFAIILKTTIPIATGLFGFIILCISMRNLRALFIILLFTAGFANLYLGNQSFITVITGFLCGLSIFLLHWIFYRKKNIANSRRTFPWYLSIFSILCASILIYFISLKNEFNTEPPKRIIFFISQKSWWKQTSPILPLYSTNRTGKHVGFFNVQYVGSLELLENSLKQQGWISPSNSFFYKLLLRSVTEYSKTEYPLLTQLYLNQKPVLIMLFKSKTTSHTIFTLRLWPSEYRISPNQTLWIGSIQSRDLNAKIPSWSLAPKILLPALTQFKYKFILYPNTPMILLIAS